MGNRELPLAENLFLKLGQKEALTNFSGKSEEHRVVAIKNNTYFGLIGIMPYSYNNVFFVGKGNLDAASNELNLLLGALRLIKSLPIQYTGWVSENPPRVAEGSFGLQYFTHIYWSNHRNRFSDYLFYTREDFKLAKEIVNQLKNFDSNTRLKQIIYNFFRIDLWTANSPFYYQFDLLNDYFRLLDKLCLNPYGGEIISSCFGKWLEHIYRGIDFENIIKNLWDKYGHYTRHSLYTTFSPSLRSKDDIYPPTENEVAKDAALAIRGLHEILRLGILSLLYLPDAEIKSFNNAPPIENHKPKPDRIVKNKEHNQYIKIFFNSLIDKKVSPKRRFWLPNIHDGIFGSFCKVKPN